MTSYEQFSTHSHHATDAHYIDVDIRHELSQNAFCDTADFVPNLFEADEETVKAVLAKANSTELYTGSRWHNIPQGNVVEATLYLPFINILSFIAEKIPKSPVRWVSDPNRPVPNTDFTRCQCETTST